MNQQRREPAEPTEGTNGRNQRKEAAADADAANADAPASAPAALQTGASWCLSLATATLDQSSRQSRYLGSSRSAWQQLASPMTLKQLWKGGRDGHLNPPEQVRAWALRETMQENGTPLKF